MDRAVRELVQHRAGDCCEYCRLPQQADPIFTFHVEHVVARKHLGTDELENLALACHHCNFHKGTNLSGIDPESDAVTTLFHPRRDRWDEHFVTRDGEILGTTAAGRATMQVLQMNRPDRVELRAEWINELGR